MYLLLVLLLGQQVCLPEICGNDEAEDVDLPRLVEVAHRGVQVIIEVLLLQSPYNLAEADLLLVVLFDHHLYGYRPVRVSFLLEDYVELSRERRTLSS